MTLKLVRLQKGTFDTVEGEFEWFGTVCFEFEVPRFLAFIDIRFPLSTFLFVMFLI